MLFLGPSSSQMSSMDELRPSFLHPYNTPTKYQKESLEATTDAWSSSKCVFRQLVLNPSKNGSPRHRISPLVRSLFTRQSSRASFGSPRHNSSPVLVPRSTKGRARRLTSKQRTNKRRNSVTWRTIFTGIQDLLAEDAVLRTTKRQFCFKRFCLVFCGCGSCVRVQETWPQVTH